MTVSPQTQHQSSPSSPLCSFLSLETSHHPASAKQTSPTGPLLFPRDVFTIHTESSPPKNHQKQLPTFLCLAQLPCAHSCSHQCCRYLHQLPYDCWDSHPFQTLSVTQYLCKEKHTKNIPSASSSTFWVPYLVRHLGFKERSGLGRAEAEKISVDLKWLKRFLPQDH